MRRNTSIRRQSIFNLCKINICNNKLNMSKWMQWKNDTHKKKCIYVVCLAQFQFLNNIIVKQITKKKFKKTCDKIAFERCKSKTSLSVAHFYMVVTLSCSFNFKAKTNSLKEKYFWQQMNQKLLKTKHELCKVEWVQLQENPSPNSNLANKKYELGKPFWHTIWRFAYLWVVLRF
jgi:hypothetical protein